MHFSHENKKKFALDHMYIIPGTAPEALEELPVPTHAFIGGSSGNMKEIVELLIKKNLQVRIVINCITLETVGEALGCIRELAKQEGCECENEIVQLCVARSKEYRKVSYDDGRKSYLHHHGTDA